MPAPLPSSTRLPSTISCLPPEVIFAVFGHLDEPRDLHHASLTCKSWRAIAIDTRLWEDKYWRYYRGGRSQDHRENKRLLQRATEKRHAAMRQWHRLATPSTASLPPFLDSQVVLKRPGPDFHGLFVARMNQDDRLLEHLRRHVARTTCTLGSMLQIIHRYGDSSRELLAALAADQQISSHTVAAFLSTTDDEEPPLRAIEVHSRSAAGNSQPQRRDFLALRYAAQTILSHFQRREAVRSVATLRQRWRAEGEEANTLRQRVLVMSSGAEEAFCDLALFRSGERIEVTAYLDLLALYVSAWLDAEQRNSRAGRSNPAGQQAPIIESTRARMAGINLALHSLNFGLAPEADSHDMNNNFLNVALCCPTQRRCHAPVLMVITCAVARRLGIAAAPIDQSETTIAVVIEDSGAPASWLGDSDEQEWGRFFILPSQGKPSRILELGPLKLEMGTSDADSDLEPDAPASLLYRVVFDITASIHHGLQVVQGDIAGGPSQGALATKVSMTSANPPQDELSRLFDYFAGHMSSPPWPLASPLLPSTLAFLPSTRAGAPRVDIRAVRDDGAGVCAWINRLTLAVALNMTETWDQQIMSTCIGSLAIYGAHRADIALLFELGGGDIMPWLMISGQIGTEEGSDDDGGSEGDSEWETESDGETEAVDEAEQPRPSSALKNHVGQVIGLDRLPCNGMGGSGGMGPSQRDPPTVRVWDEAFPVNVRARFAIGTVFKHRTHGYYGAVMGRESQCRAPDAWMAAERVDDLPCGGRHQPFYNIVAGHDESHRYVAQCNIVPVRVSSANEIATMQELVPLLNLRAVGKLFRTVQVVKSGAAGAGGKEEAKGGVKKRSRAASQRGGVSGEVRLVMNEWTRSAWPHD